MTITASTKLGETDVRKMVDEAKQFEEQDRQRKEEVETRNIADSLVYTAEKTKTDLADKLNPDMVERLNAAITAVKAALEGKDTSGIKTETEKLQKVLGEAGTAAYSRRPPGNRQNSRGLPRVRNSLRRMPAVRAMPAAPVARTLLTPTSK